MKRQKEFELDGHNDAIRDLDKQLNDAKQKAYFSSTLQARETIKYLALPMKQELINWLHELCKGRAVTMASPAMAPELLNLMEFTSTDVICVILLKSVLDTHGQFDNPTIARVANFIGERIEDEVRFRFYEKTAPEEVVAAARKRVKQIGSTPKYRRLGTKILTENMLREKYPDSALFKKWDDLFRIGIGLLLLEFCHYFGLIEKYTKRKGKKTTNYIRLTDTFKQMHSDKFDEMKSVCYKAEPLIEPPEPWKYRKGPARLNWSGGYHNDFIRKQHRLCRGYHYESEFGELSIKFLNMIGETAWTVDHTIVKVAQDLKRRGISAGNFNAYERDPRLDDKMPEHLTKLHTEHPERVTWRKNQFRLHQIHNEEWRKAVRSVKSLQAAEKFLSYPRFYLSWSNDYRGRCYPQQPWLSPQTTEFEKSLIKFADGCKLDERGKWWAAQAIGAAYLGTRLNLEERVKWTYANEALIRRIATEPLSAVTEWEQAKEPWQFLQLCIEWHKVVLTGKEQLWHIPVGADATASGLQLLSSMLLDPVGMKYSNVLPPAEDGDPPQDSYLEVLRVTREIAETEAPHLVGYLHERSIGKTTMQMLYGATHYTVREKVIKIFKKDLELFPRHRYLEGLRQDRVHGGRGFETCLPCCLQGTGLA